MRPIIVAENLGKQYRIGAHQAPYATLRESLVKAVKAPFKRSWRNGRSADQMIWALKDIRFEVTPGEVVGIIGRNGAGKSTLLKILSRITEPTTGWAELYGRVGSLLEVGTGFHPELTGRENIYLNGALLGMKRAEIDRKFDEIVAFAEIEKFIDTSVKYYSSGMYVRLAFAVAAHLEPEILLVDEVLAVGDVAFQKKCLGKMGEVAQAGRTILFVSHSESAVRRLCSTAILLHDGKVEISGDVASVFAKYKSLLFGAQSGTLNRAQRIRRSDVAEIVDGYVSDGRGQRTQSFMFGDTLMVMMRVRVLKRCRMGMEVIIKDSWHQPVVFSSSGIHEGVEFELPEGEYNLQCAIPHLPLAQGEYHLDLMLAQTAHRFLDYLENGLSLTITECDPHQTGYQYLQGRGQGCIYLNAHYEALGEA
jgi:lipopolysaccharide transport system ATP-binding protein